MSAGKCTCHDCPKCILWVLEKPKIVSDGEGYNYAKDLADPLICVGLEGGSEHVYPRVSGVVWVPSVVDFRVLV